MRRAFIMRSRQDLGASFLFIGSLIYTDTSSSSDLDHGLWTATVEQMGPRSYGIVVLLLSKSSNIDALRGL